jgi:hypothetical protein
MDNIYKQVIEILIHLGAIGIFLYGLFGFSIFQPISTLQETTIALWQIKFLLISLMIEIFNFTIGKWVKK